ncbi:hypothetical protein L0152_20020, partial [bacterium]|nr:hypothetical protein [bacterium]
MNSTLIKSCLSIVLVWSIGCSSSDDKPENFGSQAEADQAMSVAGSTIVSIASDAIYAPDIAFNFDGTLTLEEAMQNGGQHLSKSPAKTTGNIFPHWYNPATGIWTFDSTASFTDDDDDDVELSFHYEIGFSPINNPSGLPNDNTESMHEEFEVSFSISHSGEDEDEIFTSSLT